MDKHPLLQSVLKEIRVRIDDSKVQLTEILRRANEAPGAMQSHSDTDKNLYGRQAAGQKEAIDGMEKELVATEMSVFDGTDKIVIGSLVTVDDERGVQRYFLLPGGGGITVESSNGPVVVITPRTPLGAALLDKKRGETVHIAARIVTIREID